MRSKAVTSSGSGQLSADFTELNQNLCTETETLQTSSVYAAAIKTTLLPPPY